MKKRMKFWQDSKFWYMAALWVLFTLIVFMGYVSWKQ